MWYTGRTVKTTHAHPTKRMNNLRFDSPALLDLYRRYDVSRLAVFGSVARGQATRRSDVDLLVAYSRPKSLLQHAALQRQISEIIGRKVDLLTEAALSPYLRDRIVGESRVVFLASRQRSPSKNGVKSDDRV